jgi:hypothetical protein
MNESIDLARQRSIPFKVNRGDSIDCSINVYSCVDGVDSLYDFTGFTARMEVFPSENALTKLMDVGVELSSGVMRFVAGPVLLKKETAFYKLWVTDANGRETPWFNGPFLTITGEVDYVFGNSDRITISPDGDTINLVVSPNYVVINSENALDNFGIVGDGVTDDSEALFAAFQFSSRNNVPAVITGGYEISLGGNSIEIPAGVTIMFAGGTIINGTLVGNQTAIEARDYQIFDTDITLQGSFSMPYICPQHFGAVANDSLSDTGNECSEAIQKCINSPVRAKVCGFFLCNDTLIFETPKDFEMVGWNQPDGANGFNNTLGLYPEHSRIYTTENIDLVIIRSGGVNITGTFDTSQVSGYDHDVIKYDLNYMMWQGKLNVNILGRMTGLSTSTGGNAIHFDQSAISSFGGFALLIDIRGYIQWYHTGLKIDADDDAHSTYINWIDANIDMNGCKRFIDADSGNESKYLGRLQCRPILPSGEEDTPCVRIKNNNSFVDCFPYDLDLGFSATYGGVGNTIAFLFEGSNTQVGHYVNYYIHTPGTVYGIEALTSPPILNTSESFIPWDKLSNKNTVIAALDNEMVAFNKRHTVTYKKFKGAGKDFETDLDPTSGSETADVSILNSGELFQPEGLPFGVRFESGADLDNDFVEIEMTPSTGTFQWLAIWMYLYQIGNHFKKIQLIEHYSDLTKDSFMITVSSFRRQKTYYTFDQLPDKASTKTLIRLIGAQVKGADTEVYLQSICGTKARHEVLPFIHINGGQRIFGDLTTGQYKLAAMNSAPSSASATGTLGEIRVTSTHIYVCIATNTWVRAALSSW